MKHIIDDNDKNKYEAMDKAETLAAIQQIIEEGEIPTELINGVALTLRNPLDNTDYKIAFCTQAKYNELVANEQVEENCYYYITDDTTWDDFVDYVENILTETTSDLDQRVTELERYPINVDIDSTDPKYSVDLTNIIDNGAIISVCLQVTVKGTSNVIYYSSIIHIDDLNHSIVSLAGRSLEWAADSVVFGYNATNKKLYCSTLSATSPTPSFENPQFLDIKILAKW